MFLAFTPLPSFMRSSTLVKTATSAPALAASLASCLSNSFLSTTTPLNGIVISFPFGKMNFTYFVRLTTQLFGGSNRLSRSVTRGVSRLISSRLGRNSPHLSGTPTSSSLSTRRTSNPASAADFATLDPAGPAPATTTSYSGFSS